MLRPLLPLARPHPGSIPCSMCKSNKCQVRMMPCHCLLCSVCADRHKRLFVGTPVPVCPSCRAWTNRIVFADAIENTEEFCRFGLRAARRWSPECNVSVRAEGCPLRGSMVQLLPCRHSFCDHCLDGYFARSRTNTNNEAKCPSCRRCIWQLERSEHMRRGGGSGDLCHICIENPVETVLLPCQHTACRECASRLSMCSMCRGRILGYEELVAV